jgi:hypothetical protein
MCHRPDRPRPEDDGIAESTETGRLARRGPVAATPQVPATGLVRVWSGPRGGEGRAAKPIAQPDTRRARKPAAKPSRIELVRLAPSGQRNRLQPGAECEDCGRVRITPVASEHVAEDVVHGAQPQP